jgi:hypothetical protein
MTEPNVENAIDAGIEAASVFVTELADKTWGGREFNIARVAATAAVQHCHQATSRAPGEREFIAARVEQLVADMREAGGSDEAIIAALSEGIEALKEGLS